MLGTSNGAVLWVCGRELLGLNLAILAFRWLASTVQDAICVLVTASDRLALSCYVAFVSSWGGCGAEDTLSASYGPKLQLFTWNTGSESYAHLVERPICVAALGLCVGFFLRSVRRAVC